MGAEEGLEDLLVGLVLAGGGFFGLVEELQFFEEDLAELFGGVQIEGGTGEVGDAAVEFGGLFFELETEVLEDGDVDGDAGIFHAGEDREEGGFDLGEDAILAAFGKEVAEEFGELPGDVGVFGGVVLQFFGGLLGDVSHGVLAEEVVLTADEVGDRDGGVGEVGFGEVVHAVALLGLDERVGEHGVEEGAGDFEAVGEEDGEIELEVVTDFFDVGVGEEGAEFFENGGGFFWGAGEEDELAGVFFGGKGDADDAGVAGVKGGGFEVETEAALVLEAVDEGGAFFGGADEVVVVLGVGDGVEFVGGMGGGVVFAEEVGGRQASGLLHGCCGGHLAGAAGFEGVAKKAAA